MYCAQCGELASANASFCKKCGSALNSGPAGPQTVAAPAASQPGMNFSAVRIMNIVGATGIGLITLFMLVSMHGKLHTWLLIFFAAYFAFLLMAPLTTIFALSDKAGKALRIVAIVLNALLVALWCFSIVGSLFSKTISFPMTLFAVFMFVVPEWINIRALRSLLKNPRGTQSD